MKEQPPIINVTYVTPQPPPDDSLWFMFSRVIMLAVLLFMLFLFVQCAGQ